VVAGMKQKLARFLKSLAAWLAGEREYDPYE
jgi:hypothetical protein